MRHTMAYKEVGPIREAGCAAMSLISNPSMRAGTNKERKYNEASGPDVETTDPPLPPVPDGAVMVTRQDRPVQPRRPRRSRPPAAGKLQVPCLPSVGCSTCSSTSKGLPRRHAHLPAILRARVLRLDTMRINKRVRTGWPARC